MENLKTFEIFRNHQINEALRGETGKPSEIRNFEVGTVLKIGEELFPTGKSNIKTENLEFRKLVDICKKLPKQTEIEVVGGASAVGSPTFDNKKLAEDRANNLIEALKKAGVVDLVYKSKGVVGKATVKDSPEALAEQFVKIKRLGKTTSQTAIAAIDNTVVKAPITLTIDDKDKSKKMLGDKKLYRVVKIYYPKNKNEDWWKKTLPELQKITENGIVDVTSQLLKK